MTETSPDATVSPARSQYDDADEDTRAAARARQGWPHPLVELRLADPETGEPLPWDDTATGELQAAGPFIAADYYRGEGGGAQFTADGWLRTGDVATVDRFGSVRLVDRTKDLVKSGGEWISSVELESAIMSHPKVAEAAVIGIPHERWTERPLACVVTLPGETLTRGGGARAPRTARSEVVAARRRRVHRRGAQDQRRKVLKAHPSGAVRRLLAHRPRGLGSGLTSRAPSRGRAMAGNYCGSCHHRRRHHVPPRAPGFRSAIR